MVVKMTPLCYTVAGFGERAKPWEQGLAWIIVAQELER